MPMNSETRWKMNQLEKHLLDFLERDHGRVVDENERTYLKQAQRHLGGLFAALRQLDPRTEKRVWDTLAGYSTLRSAKGQQEIDDAIPPDPNEHNKFGKDPVSRSTRGTKKRTNK